MPQAEPPVGPPPVRTSSPPTHREPHGPPVEGDGEGAVVRDATFLNAVLPYALAQARRHGEPLTVLCLEVDRLASLARSRGVAAAREVVARVAEAAARALRASD